MKTLISVVVAILVIWGIWAFAHRHSDTANTASSTPVASENDTGEAEKGNMTPIGTLATSNQIQVTSPMQDQTISSPLTVSGKARGNWFFEASAPVYVIDSAGNQLGRGTIKATGDWMTTDFVPFTGTITFTAPGAGITQGGVVFMNDNPSGQASTSLFFLVPIKFAPGTATSTS